MEEYNQERQEDGDMKHCILGITGGVGSGKSTVLDILEKDYGAYVIQADRVAHELMEPGQASYQAIVEHFGQEILTEDGHIDRKALGTIVFADQEKLTLLNSLTHPAVKTEICRRILEQFTKAVLRERTEQLSVTDVSNSVFIVIEAALLLEDHYDQICDEIWYVFADREVRFQRLAESRGYSREKSQSMMEKQMSDEELRLRCQAVIDNSSTLEETKAMLAGILQERTSLSWENL